MIRRLSVVALLVASVVAGACSNPTAPDQGDTPSLGTYGGAVIRSDSGTGK